MFTDIHPINEVLDNGLILKSVGTHDEIERLAEFNAFIHEEDILNGMTRAMIVHHPHTRPGQWLFVEDPSTGQIVSSLCLIPWRWKYGEVTLKAGEMGIVGTHPDYRRRGLIRTLTARFKVLLDEGGFDVSHIQGIPYYYRQFGYEYALPLEGGWRIEPHQIPDELPAYAQGYTFRAATEDDVPLLTQLYTETSASLDIWAIRDADMWRYQIAHGEDTSDGHTTWVITDPQGACAGYVRIASRGFGSGLIVNEASALTHGAVVAALSHIKQMARDLDKPYIRLSLVDSHALITIARAWGAHNEGRYAWQIHIPDPARLLRTITPVLERRIANSLFAGLSHTLTLNLYNSAVNVIFANGHITAITTSAAAEGNPENHIPPTLLAPWVLGWRNRDELEAIYPDFAAWGLTQPLLDVLFPKMRAFLYEHY